MKKTLQFLCLICMALIATTAKAESYEDVTAMWDFKNDLPSGIQESTNYQKTTATIESTVSGISMTVDATNGKLYCVGRNNAQINTGTILQIPVQSTKDTVTIVGYGGNYSPTFSINGTTYSDDEVVYVAKTADVEQGYVKAEVTGNGYINSVKVVQKSKYEEKPLYETDFTDWDDLDRKKTTDEVVTKATKYSHETLSFTLNGVGIDNDGTNAKFPNYTGWMIFAKYTNEYSDAEPSCVTSSLGSVTKVVFTQAATGGNRGVKMSVKGDGDDDWVALFNQKIGTSSGETQTIEVNRTNCQIKFENFTLNQNGYIVDLKIYGYVDMSTTPSLGTFTMNGTSYEAADYFSENSDGNMVAAIEISKDGSMISESNPLADLVASNGEIGTVTYTTTGSGSDQTTVATIPVTANGETKNYILTVSFLPDYTITYYDVDASTVVGTQAVEKNQAIGTFSYGESNVTVKDGYKFRGWAVSTEDKNQMKYDETYVVTGDLSVYALVTDIETANDSLRYDYDLTSQYFDPADHEGFTLTGSGKYYNNHGWTIADGDEIALLCGGTGYISLALCRYGSNCTITLKDPSGNEVGTYTAPAESDGALSLVNFDGLESGTYTLSFSGSTYLHSVSVVNTSKLPYTKNGQWYIIEAGDADGLQSTIEMVCGYNGASSAERSFIFLPDGTYDFGNKCLTNISGYNISLIGQSMDGVIIKNLPEAEGIGVTATILNTSSDLYMQDLTLQNAWDYTGSTGRAVCLQDKGKQTISKNVKLLSYQDTYYSNAAGDFYWETSELHGVVDYLCGSGDVYYNQCTLVNENVNGKSATMTAPYPSSSDEWGYVFESCTIESPVKFNYGRSWGGNSKLTYLNTILNQPGNIVNTRFTEGGMNTVAYDFNEYNTVDTAGNVVSPSSLTVNFTITTNNVTTTNEQQIILSDSEAEAYAYDKIFSNGWDPKTLCIQVDAPEATIDSTNTIKWEAVDGAIAYAVFGDGKFIDIVSDGSTELAVDGTASTYTVRSANSMGGFGEEADVTTGIKALSSSSDIVSSKFYNLSGMQVNSAFNGTKIKVNTFKNGTTKAVKIAK